MCTGNQIFIWLACTICLIALVWTVEIPAAPPSGVLSQSALELSPLPALGSSPRADCSTHFCKGGTRHRTRQTPVSGSRVA